MTKTLSLLALLAWAQAPSSPKSPGAKRANVATTLIPDAPLDAKPCDLPTSGSPRCEPPKKDESHHHHHPLAAAAEVVDPVCGMKIDPATAGGGSLTENGKTVHFCSSACRHKYLSRADGGTP